MLIRSHVAFVVFCALFACGQEKKHEDRSNDGCGSECRLPECGGDGSAAPEDEPDLGSVGAGLEAEEESADASLDTDPARDGQAGDVPVSPEWDPEQEEPDEAVELDPSSGASEATDDEDSAAEHE